LKTGTFEIRRTISSVSSLGGFHTREFLLLNLSLHDILVPLPSLSGSSSSQKDTTDDRCDSHDDFMMDRTEASESRWCSASCDAALCASSSPSAAEPETGDGGGSCRDIFRWPVGVGTCFPLLPWARASLWLREGGPDGVERLESSSSAGLPGASGTGPPLEADRLGAPSSFSSHLSKCFSSLSGMRVEICPTSHLRKNTAGSSGQPITACSTISFSKGWSTSLTYEALDASAAIASLSSDFRELSIPCDDWQAASFMV